MEDSMQHHISIFYSKTAMRKRLSFGLCCVSMILERELMNLSLVADLAAASSSQQLFITRQRRLIYDAHRTSAVSNTGLRLHLRELLL